MTAHSRPVSDGRFGLLTITTLLASTYRLADGVRDGEVVGWAADGAAIPEE